MADEVDKGPEMGHCPDCRTELKRVGHAPGKAKGRYKCMNRECSNNRWMNRHGEDRLGAA